MLGTELLLGEAARLLDAVGALAERITIVGGLVPALLVPEPPPHVGAHGGTRDIDLGLGIVLSGDEANDFRPLEPALLSLGYRPMAGEAEQYRWLGGPGDAVVVEFLCGRPRGFNDRDIVSIGDRLAAVPSRQPGWQRSTACAERSRSTGSLYRSGSSAFLRR